MLIRVAAISIGLALSLPAAPTRIPLAPLAFTPEGGNFTARGIGYAVTLSPNGAAIQTEGSSLQLRVRGANSAARPTPLNLLPGRQHFLIGKDSTHWRHSLPTYASIAYPAILPGIDLIYYGSGKQLEYDFTIAPGADPRQIQVEVSTGWTVHITAKGELELRGPNKAATRFGFQLGRYDHSRPLVIDPVVLWGT